MIYILRGLVLIDTIDNTIDNPIIISDDEEDDIIEISFSSDSEDF